MGKKVVIVGGVASAAARLCRLDEAAEIIMFERDEYISFANCGLPYYIGESIAERSKLLIQTPQSMKNHLISMYERTAKSFVCSQRPRQLQLKVKKKGSMRNNMTILYYHQEQRPLNHQ